MAEMNETGLPPNHLKLEGHSAISPYSATASATPVPATNNTERLDLSSISKLTNIELVLKWETERAVAAYQADDYATFGKLSIQLLYNSTLPLFHRAKVS
jgi:hypothetical protein